MILNQCSNLIVLHGSHGDWDQILNSIFYLKTRILVTGATGFIGHQLVDYLESFGNYEIIKSTRENISENDKLTLDFSNLASIEQADLSKIKIVIHLAAAVHNKITDSEEVETINYRSSALLARKCVFHNVSKFIFISTIGVHGSNTDDVVSEKSEINCQTIYSQTKYKAEKAIIQETQNSDMTYTILRPVLVLGRQAPGNIEKLHKLIQTFIPLPFARIENSRTLIHVKDLVKVISHVIKEPKTENKTYVVGSLKSVTTTDLIKYLGKGRNNMFFIPKVFFNVIFSLLGRKTLYKQLFDSYEVDSRNLFNDIGWIANYPLHENDES